MKISEAYAKIPADISGAMSKNRFQFEVLWGASKMFDLFDNEDFCVVFDYKCDIEVHLPTSFEFYQIKTHKVQLPYTLAKISRKEEGGASILGKLFLIKNAIDSTVKTKVVIVSNAYLKIGSKIYSEYEEIQFDRLDDVAQQKIREALKSELGGEIDLTNVSFLYTSMSLLETKEALCGKIACCFEKIMGCELIKPVALTRLIIETANSRACYELKTTAYKDLIQKKGITKQELLRMLSRHASLTDIAVSEAEVFIKKTILSPRQRRAYNHSLIFITKQLSSPSELSRKVADVANFLTENQDSLPDSELETLEMLYSQFDGSFSIEYSESDKKVFLLIVLLKWIGGKI